MPYPSLCRRCFGRHYLSSSLFSCRYLNHSLRQSSPFGYGYGFTGRNRLRPLRPTDIKRLRRRTCRTLVYKLYLLTESPYGKLLIKRVEVVHLRSFARFLLRLSTAPSTLPADDLRVIDSRRGLSSCRGYLGHSFNDRTRSRRLFICQVRNKDDPRCRSHRRRCSSKRHASRFFPEHFYCRNGGIRHRIHLYGNSYRLAASRYYVQNTLSQTSTCPLW